MISYWTTSYSDKVFPCHRQFLVLRLILSGATIHLRPSTYAYLAEIFHFLALLLRLLFTIFTDSIPF